MYDCFYFCHISHFPLIHSSYSPILAPQLSDDESDDEEEEVPVAKKKRKTVAKVKAAVKDKVKKKTTAATTTKAAKKKGILTKRGPSTPTTDPEESADEALENKTSDYAGGAGVNYGGGDWRSFCAVDW